MTLAEALVYQREQDEAKRPFYGNPNLARQGRNVERQRAFPFMPAADLPYETPATMNPNLAAQGEAYRANMTPPTSVMDPRYPAWKQNQDAADAVGAVGDLALSAIPMAGPALQGAKAAGRFAAPVAGQALENYMVRSGGILPMDTWHGSPHRFPPTAKNPLGEFDPMKVGTGEGAQAYGAGAGYLAENPKVAKSYKQTEGAYKRVTGGMTNKQEFVADHLSQGRPEMNILEMYAQKYGGSFDDAMKDLMSVKEMYGSGYLYKVDLPDEQIAKMLDWDKPLSQQPKTVKDLMAKMSIGESEIDGFKTLAKSPEGAAIMREAGIPGIRYLDQGSRAGGAGTSNFVVFDPKHMNIIGRE